MKRNRRGREAAAFRAFARPESACERSRQVRAKEEHMHATETLHELGQSLWLDNITRELLDSGQLQTYIDDYSVTGLTSNPSIFDKAIAGGGYDDAIPRSRRPAGSRGALLRARDRGPPARRRHVPADPRADRRRRRLGLARGLSAPRLRHGSTVEAAKTLHDQAGRDNLFIKIPGTKEGLPAIEEAIFAGVPVNVTLLFSREHYLAAADAYMRGVERRIEAGLNPSSARSPPSSCPAGTSRSSTRCPTG